jgi:hypothetical protein
MHHAITHAFTTDATEIVLIGTDIPDLPATLITQAFTKLHDHDIVLGPSYDGGYYLLACTPHTLLPQMFTNIPWSTTNVLPTTLDILTTHHRTVYILPPWHDIDTPDDLTRLLHHHEPAFKSSHTITYLTHHPLMETHLK